MESVYVLYGKWSIFNLHGVQSVDNDQKKVGEIIYLVTKCQIRHILGVWLFKKIFFIEEIITMSQIETSSCNS